MSGARDLILEAAERILLRTGPQHLTAEAVTVEAGVSKGAFFYHFPTKDDLFLALVGDCTRVLETEIGDESARDDDPVGRDLRSRLRCSFGIAGHSRERLLSLTAAFLTAALESKKVVAQFRDRRAEELATADKDGLPAVQRLLVLLALDGLWIGEALGTVKLAPELREQLVSVLMELTRRALPPCDAKAPAPTKKKPRKAKKKTT
jgi:AcrR family transcriptional regulator